MEKTTIKELLCSILILNVHFFAWSRPLPRNRSLIFRFLSLTGIYISYLLVWPSWKVTMLAT